MAARERETRKSKANETTQEGNTQRYRREKRRSHERIERERERERYAGKNWERWKFSGTHMIDWLKGERWGKTNRHTHTHTHKRMLLSPPPDSISVSFAFPDSFLFEISVPSYFTCVGTIAMTSIHRRGWLWWCSFSPFSPSRILLIPSTIQTEHTFLFLT